MASSTHGAQPSAVSVGGGRRAIPISDIRQNKDLVRRYFAALGASDFDALFSLMASDLRFTCAGGSGSSYDNRYAFFFWIRDGRIVEVHEHLGTAYVGAELLQPAGIGSGSEMPWLRAGG